MRALLSRPAVEQRLVSSGVAQRLGALQFVTVARGRRGVGRVLLLWVEIVGNVVVISHGPQVGALVEGTRMRKGGDFFVVDAGGSAGRAWFLSI